MKRGSIYEKQSGRILITVVAPDEESVILQITDQENQSLIMDVEGNGRTQYILNGEISDRPKMSLLIEVDGSETELAERTNIKVGELLKIAGIPKGTTVFHPGGELTVDDGYIDWSAAETGEYHFRFANFPYQEEHIHAVVG